MERYIQIEPLKNGSHIHSIETKYKHEKGWAVIPNDMATPNFPFGEVTVDETQTPPVVTGWTAGTIPEPDPEPEPEPTQLDRVEAQATYTAMMTDTLLEV